MYGLSQTQFTELRESIMVQLRGISGVEAGPALAVGWDLIAALENVLKKSESIVWFIGSEPDIYLSEHIVDMVLQFKELTDDA